MLSYRDMSKEKLRTEQKELQKKYEEMKSMNYNLNMARGKPCKEQLDLSQDIMKILEKDDYRDETGFDLRNYGILDGIPSAKKIFSQILDIAPENIVVGGNSSLNLIYDTVARAMLFGVPGSKRPWVKEEKIKFLCPVPGYDRHFGVTKDLGIQMINIPMTPKGPDMDMVEELVSADPFIKGIWCVPLYSNPDGITYSKETCERLASMKCAAGDFRIMWDNAYCVHHLSTENPDTIPEITKLCKKHKNPDRAFVFTSTSKITWPGSGISCVASSPENIKYLKSHMNYQTIGSDKINQKRQVAFLRDYDNIKVLMEEHAKIMRPKFKTVFEIMNSELKGRGVARWNEPRGGYFISLYVMDLTAKKVVSLCKDCGVVLTPAGATFPYGNDPRDNNIRIAPTFPPSDELETAIKIVCLCVRLAAVNRLLGPVYEDKPGDKQKGKQ